MDIASTSWTIAPDTPREARLPLTETTWGYIIHGHLGPSGSGTTATPKRLIAFGLIFLAYAQWLLPDSFYAGDPTMAKAAISLTLGVIGTAAYWGASRPSNMDLEVDTGRRELRLVHRSGGGDVQVRSRVPMDKIAYSFISKPKSVDRAQLCLRLRDSSHVVHVAWGTGNMLRALHLRLSHDLRTREDTRPLPNSPPPLFKSCRAA